VNDHDERADYAEGPPPDPWLSRNDWYVVIGLGLLVALMVFGYVLEKFFGVRTAN
jgi:hypothetical protein